MIFISVFEVMMREMMQSSISAVAKGLSMALNTVLGDEQVRFLLDI